MRRAALLVGTATVVAPQVLELQHLSIEKLEDRLYRSLMDPNCIFVWEYPDGSYSLNYRSADVARVSSGG